MNIELHPTNRGWRVFSEEGEFLHAYEVLDQPIRDFLDPFAERPARVPLASVVYILRDKYAGERNTLWVCERAPSPASPFVGGRSIGKSAPEEIKPYRVRQDGADVRIVDGARLAHLLRPYTTHRDGEDLCVERADAASVFIILAVNEVNVVFDLG